MNLSAPNAQQVEDVIRWLLAVGGPLGAIIIAQTSVDVLNQITTLALYFGPPLISLVWGLFARTERNQLKAAGSIRGVLPIKVDMMPGRASLGAQEAAKDPGVSNVGPAQP